jgi:DNA-binding response OmpR family regulator
MSPTCGEVRFLVADDDRAQRRLLESILGRWGQAVSLAEDGLSAWEQIACCDAPLLAILDWTMPGLDGLELCRRIRRLPETRSVHAILLTAHREKEDVLTGLEAGADDYVTKPFDPQELYARVRVGLRVLRLQGNLAAQVNELQAAVARIRQLQGLLPICCYCKSIRGDHNYWQQVEHYLAAHSDVQFSHGICPTCYKSVVEPQLAARRKP